MLHQKIILHPGTKLYDRTYTYSDRTIRRMTYLLSFLIPVIVMLIVFASKEIFPFGERSFLRTDLYHQYAPFTKALKRLLKEGGSFFYTWESGLGTNFLSEYGYYLASPTNWLLVFIPESFVIEFISYLVILKIGLCGLTMSFYLTRHNQKPDIAIAFFSIFYALSGYICAYSWNIMWMDSIVLFPIVIWAVERLVKEDKCFLYTLTLALSILTNYYIGIMFCLFLPIYFVVQLCTLDFQTLRTFHSSKKDVVQYRIPNYGKKIANFCIFSLLAGGLAAVILAPVYSALFTTASSSGNFQIDADYEPYFSMFDILSRHLILTDTHQRLDHWPNIYCGVAIFFLLPLYAMNTKVKTREKVCYFALIFLFLISFNQECLEFIWHGLHKPNSLPARQSFIYIFLLLCMGYQGWQWLKSASKGQLLGSVAFAIGFIVLAEHLVTQEEVHWYSYYVSFLFIVIYGIICHLYQKHREWNIHLLIFALCMLMIESCVNMAVTSVTTVSRTSYTKYDEGFSTVLEAAEEAEGENFYRVERADRRTKNDGAWYDYNSASIFSSAANASLTDFYKMLGMEGSTNSYCATGSTWFASMLLNIQYTLSANPITTVNEDMLTLFAEEENAYLYKNNYSLPLGFLASFDVEAWSGDAANPIDNQKSLAQKFIGDRGSELYIRLNTTNNTDTTSTIDVQEDGYIYVYVAKSSKAKTIAVSSSSLSKTFENVNRGYILDLGWHEAGDTIDLSCEEEGPMYVNAYRMNLEVLYEIYESLSQTAMVVDSYDNTNIHAHIEIAEGESGLLMTSIPYDEGWTVTINGEAVDCAQYGDAMIVLPFYESGYFELEFHYRTPGFSTGVLLSLLSLLVLGLLFLLFRFLKHSPLVQSKLAAYQENEARNAFFQLEESMGKQGMEEILPYLNETERRLLEEQEQQFEQTQDEEESENIKQTNHSEMTSEATEPQTHSDEVTSEATEQQKHREAAIKETKPQTHSEMISAVTEQQDQNEAASGKAKQ